jgi:endonuclease/exonuclease/phosphatase family metal-dependent hydrolase
MEKAHQYEIILMGDFNLRYETYEEQKVTN